MTHTIAATGRAVIDAYGHIRVGETSVACPYINNKRHGLRGALPVQVGKGSPADIEDEIRTLTVQKKIDLSGITTDQALAFLIEHHLGVECSGFVYHVLDAVSREEYGRPLAARLTFSGTWLRKQIALLRPATNVNVQLLASDQNSAPVQLNNAQPGDLIIMLDSGQHNDVRDHVLLVTSVEKDAEGTITSLTYHHSLQWSNDGPLHHGVRSGTIEITDVNKPLVNQTWTEQTKTNSNGNETYDRATRSSRLELRRLN